MPQRSSSTDGSSFQLPCVFTAKSVILTQERLACLLSLFLEVEERLAEASKERSASRPHTGHVDDWTLKQIRAEAATESIGLRSKNVIQTPALGPEIQSGTIALESQSLTRFGGCPPNSCLQPCLPVRSHLLGLQLLLRSVTAHL